MSLIGVTIDDKKMFLSLCGDISFRALPQKKQLDPKQSHPILDNDIKKDGVQLLLETLRFLCLNERNISLVAICAVI